jgi:hypothetical protein
MDLMKAWMPLPRFRRPLMSKKRRKSSLGQLRLKCGKSWGYKIENGIDLKPQLWKFKRKLGIERTKLKLYIPTILASFPT